MLGRGACFGRSFVLFGGVLRHSPICADGFKRVPEWNALRELQVPPRKTVDGVATLDSTLDMVGYQLFRDGLLPPPPLTFHQRRQQQMNEFRFPSELRKMERERLRAQKRLQKNGIVLRRSIKETFVTIGCDEAGRGPLAGPVVGAAVCRIPLSSFNNDLHSLYEAEEHFQIFDSKSVSEVQRNLVYNKVTGYSDFFTLVANKNFLVHHAAGDSSSPSTLRSKQKFHSHTKLCKLPFKKLLSMQTPYLVTFHGNNVSGNHLYLWSIGIANHTYIDAMNIYRASMNTMHRCCLTVWGMLSDTNFCFKRAPRPPRCSIAQYLFSRFCILASHDHRKRYRPPSHIDLVEGASEFFDVEPVQPPLILVDGHAAPSDTMTFFSDVETGGCVQAIIEGDKRSLTIAAASCLAKVSRDEIMNHLDTLYPRYHFAENKGYPVDYHMRVVHRHGLCAVHRRSYRPCAAVVMRKLKRKAKENPS
ncbi:putative Ribonuclease HII [Trypanosoma vivax]|uniref:Ribonuclease n=1 Tax=Trypanosoma vivax (strain Y486) TaxID=1055687 RepID=G0U6C2_TRYVY|nr:putative Ribonuclease HII [Trypanosoma vivax]CCC51426.1 putative ribonuclease HII [Trypanosoma vivax Y486]